MDTSHANTALSRAIQKWPSLKAFASELGVPYQTVQQWLKNGVPAAYCPRIEEMTGGESKCEELNSSINWTYLRGTQPYDPAPPAPPAPTPAITDNLAVGEGV